MRECMNKRVNFILAGKRDFRKTMINLKKLIASEDKTIIYTTYERYPFLQCIADILQQDVKDVENNTYYARFNEINDDSIKNDSRNHIIGIKMPNNLFDTISTAYNSMFDIVDRTGIANYIHCFTDDCFIKDNSAYDPSQYESFMETFKIPFVMDSKVNDANFIFARYAPRAVLCAYGILHYPISLAQFESKDHFVISRAMTKEKFNPTLKRLYISEFVYRLIDSGTLKFPSFYPDPILPQYVFRDISAEGHDDRNILIKEYADDDVFMRNTLKTKIVHENDISPLINYYSKIINNLKKKAGN